MTDIEIYTSIVEKLKETYIKKNSDYGGSVHRTYEDFGIVSYLTRIADKVNRLTSLYKKQSNDVKDESFRDTLLDLANYAILAELELEKNE